MDGWKYIISLLGWQVLRQMLWRCWHSLVKQEAVWHVPSGGSWTHRYESKGSFTVGGQKQRPLLHITVSLWCLPMRQGTVTEFPRTVWGSLLYLLTTILHALLTEILSSTLRCWIPLRTKIYLRTLCNQAVCSCQMSYECPKKSGIVQITSLFHYSNCS